MPNEMATVIAEESAVSATVPNAYTLNQNYPNPFNPSTTVAYAIPADGHVELTFFNALGQQVATLAEGWRMAGSYSVAVDASDLSAGTYFYLPVWSQPKNAREPPRWRQDPAPQNDLA